MGKKTKQLSNYFYKVNRQHLIDLFKLGDHKYSRLIIAAILEKITPSTNEWNATIKEIANEANVSRSTAIRVLNELTKEDFIIRKYRWLMLNPAVFCYGNKEKVSNLYRKYRTDK